LYVIIFNSLKTFLRFSSNLNSGNKISENNNSKLDFLNQALVGLLLGKFILIKKYETGGTYLKFAQSFKHKKYIEYITTLFFEVGLFNMKN
jgi:hypothetical protein